MENTCRMDCHACALQEGIENKALCATLFIPAMLNRLSGQLHRIEELLLANGAKELNEVKLDSGVNELNNKDK